MSLVIALLCMASFSSAQNPRKVAEVYETEVFGLATGAAGGGEFLLPAKLLVRPAELNGGTTSVTLELSVPTTASLIRLTKFSLPPEYESLLDGQDELLLDPGTRGAGMGMGASTGQFDITALAKAPRESAASYDVLVRNALGQPAAGAKLDIWAGMGEQALALGSRTVPSDGRVRLQVPRPGTPSSNLDPRIFIFRPFSVLEINATDASGQGQKLRFPGVTRPGGPANYDTLDLAFLPRETTASAFRGRILGPDGRPTLATGMTPDWLAFPGMGGVQFNGTAGTMYSAPDGTFCFGVAPSLLQEHLGVQDLPASSTLRVNIAGLPSVELSTDRETIIQLPHVENVRLKLVDRNGAPVAGLNPRNFRLEARTTQKPDEEPWSPLHLTAKLEDPANAIVLLSQVPVPARYTFTVNDSGFEPVFLGQGASANVVELVQLSDAGEVTGRILEAETGQPIAGAYVLSAWEQNAPRILSKTPPDLLESTWAEWNPAALTADAPSKSLQFAHGTLFSVDGLTKTNDAGQFILPYENGRVPKTVHVYLPGRMTATARVIDMEKPIGTPAIYKLPDVALPLAASVIVPIIPPDRVPDKFLNGPGVAGNTLRTVFSASVSYERAANWSPAVPSQEYSKAPRWELLTGTGWAAPGNKPELAVPAGVKLQVTVSAPYELTIGVANWRDIGPLAPGEKQVLTDQKVSAKIPFLVSVKKANGTPVAGASIRIDGHRPLTTDNEGNVIGWTTGHVDRVEALLDNTWKVAAEKRNITVNPGDNLTQVDLVVP